MPYSRKTRSIYVWIPKTAGTSIVNALEKRGVFRRDGQATLWGRIPKEDRKNHRAANWQHIAARSIAEILGETEWNDCFTFTFVRNPYDRLVSFYEYSRAARKDPGSIQYGRPDPGTFEEWFEENRPWTQLQYLTDEDGRLMVDFVGRFEHLKRDILEISRRMKMRPLRLPWRKMRSSRRADYPSYYTAGLKKRVEDVYGEEIERFGYRF